MAGIELPEFLGELAERAGKTDGDGRGVLPTQAPADEGEAQDEGASTS